MKLLPTCLLFVEVAVAVLGLIWPNPAVSASSTSSTSQRQTNQGRLRHESDESNDQGDASTCRVAVCLSGAIRSFVHHAVYGSIQGNLIGAIKADGCEVDVFAYATRQDTVGRDKQVIRRIPWVLSFCWHDNSSR